MSDKVVFTGCSLTAGAGWSQTDALQGRIVACKTAPDLWVNLCSKELSVLKNLELINLGIVGASNSDIFESTVNAISQYGSSVKILFCQWTAYPRYHWNLGFELWPTNDSVTNFDDPAFDINTSIDVYFSAADLSRFKNQYLIMHHCHWEIVKILRFTNIISRLASLHDIKIYFINGLCHWDKDFFEKIEGDHVVPEDYTTYTKKHILAIDFRDDTDIHQLYKLAHNHYQETGGVRKNQWINLYDSMFDNIIDTNYDNQHPGKLSNLKYFQQIKEILEN